MSLPDLLVGRKIVLIGVPKTIIPKETDMASLPGDWRKFPPPFELAAYGTQWAVSMGSLLLRVPSAVVTNEFNVLINPRHPDMKLVKIVGEEDFVYDERLNKMKKDIAGSPVKKAGKRKI
jgi:RES domain-containing protein